MIQVFNLFILNNILPPVLYCDYCKYVQKYSQTNQSWRKTFYLTICLDKQSEKIQSTTQDKFSVLAADAILEHPLAF